MDKFNNVVFLVNTEVHSHGVFGYRFALGVPSTNWSSII